MNPIENPPNRREIPTPPNFANESETLRLLIDSVGDYGIFVLDPHGFIQTWNLGAERLKGYTAADVIGRHFSMFYTEKDRLANHPAHELEIAERVGRYEEEGWRIKKDGSKFWANVVITRLRDSTGKTVGFGKVTRDLTERKLAEDALRAGEENARLMYETVKDYAIISLDPLGYVTSWNEGASRIKGYAASEIIGKHFSKFYTEDDLVVGKAEYELREAAATGRFEDEGWRVRKDGTRFWANVVVTALYDRTTGKLRGFSKVTRDVTERKRAEDRLRMANEGLEKRVAERTAALSSANEELTLALRARDEFLSIASHELRTPITPLKLQVQGILRHLERGTLGTMEPARLEKLGATVERSLDRLTKLIDSLLDVARINTGKIHLHPEEVDAREIILEVCHRFGIEARDAGSDVRVEIDDEIPAYLDGVRLEQVIANLVTNGLKYGGGKPIDVSAHAMKDTLLIEVRDSGIGIAPENVGKVFDRFVRVDANIASGLGLGLYITKQIVEAQGGSIRVTSELGKGSTFKVALPLPRAPADAR